jgi:hypothetical protein
MRNQAYPPKQILNAFAKFKKLKKYSNWRYNNKEAGIKIDFLGAKQVGMFDFYICLVFFLVKIQVFFLPKKCDIILTASHVQIKIRMQYSVIRHLKAQTLLVFWYILSALYIPALELDVLRPGVHVQVREEEVLLCQYLLSALHHLQAKDTLLLVHTTEFLRPFL